MRLFSEEVKPTFTNSGHNILTVESLEEVFFDVYEFEINGEKFVAEKESSYKGSPVVSLPVEIGGSIYKTLFILNKGAQEILFNEKTIDGQPVICDDEPEDIILEEEEVEEEEVIFEKKEDILNEIRAARSAAKKYAEKIKEAKINEASDEIELKEDRVNELISEARKSFVEEFLTITENTKSQIFEYNEDIETRLKEYVDGAIDQYTLDFSSTVEKDYVKSVDLLKEQIEKLTKDVYTSQLTKLIEDKVNYNIDLIDRTIGENKKDTDQHIDNKIKTVEEDILAIEKVNVDLNDSINKNVNKALSRVGIVKRGLEDSIQTLEESLDTKFKEAEQQVKDYYDKKISAVKETIEDKGLEDKQSIYKVIDDHKIVLLEKISELKENTSTTIIEKYGEKNVKIDPKKIQKDIETSLTNTFSQQLQTLRRTVEMHGGGGSVAKQFAAGGTMNGDLNVVGNILSGGTNLNDIFGSGGGGGVGGSGTLLIIYLFGLIVIAFQDR